MDHSKSLAHKEGGNKLVKNKKQAGFLSFYDLMGEIFERLLEYGDEMEIWKSDVIKAMKAQPDILVSQMQQLGVNPLQLWIIGSVLTDKFNENSDVDIAVVIDGNTQRAHDLLSGKVFFEDVGVVDIIPTNTIPTSGIRIK